MTIKDELNNQFEHDFETMSGAVMDTKDPKTIKAMCQAFYFIGAERVIELERGATIEPLREFK